MASVLITTNELTGTRVVGGKNSTKHIGKVRRFVFHPNARRCIGFVVKRPDLLWMFRRKDVFVSIEGYVLEDGRVLVQNEPTATNRGACKALGVDWDACVLWIGLPVVTEDGDTLGRVGNITFNRITGEVHSVEIDTGAAENALLGTRVVPAQYIKGFKSGIGAALALMGHEGAADEEAPLGALLVDSEAKRLAAEGGAAEIAGQATAVAVDKVKTTADKIKPVASKVAKQTGEAVNKGAWVTGRQISRSKTMFSDFKEEYDNARGKKKSANSIKSRAGAPVQSSKTESSSSKSIEKTTAKSVGKATTKSTTKQKARTTEKDSTKTGKTVKTSKKSVDKPTTSKNMFAAFKEEYDKARHEE